MPRDWLYGQSLPIGDLISSTLVLSGEEGGLISSQPPTQESRFMPSLLVTSVPLKSSAYMFQARSSCFMLLRQRMPCALVLALASAGNNMLARMAIIAITTSNSINVKARTRRGADSEFREGN